MTNKLSAARNISDTMAYVLISATTMRVGYSAPVMIDRLHRADADGLFDGAENLTRPQLFKLAEECLGKHLSFLEFLFSRDFK